MARGAMAPAGRPHPGLVLGSRLWAGRDKGRGGGNGRGRGEAMGMGRGMGKGRGRPRRGRK